VSDAPLAKQPSDEPLLMQWNGEAFAPHRRHYKRIDAEFVIGEVYTFVPYEERSAKSHAHYFACVAEAWKNLPDGLAEQFPTSEHLRKFALIKAGYADSQTFTAASKAEALRLAAFLRPVDGYSIITTEGATVTRWTAKSQSTRAMGGKVFQESKDKVLDVLAAMIEVNRPQLETAAGNNA
jgi:hypothetical protein